jgi:hypothetical protein
MTEWRKTYEDLGTDQLKPGDRVWIKSYGWGIPKHLASSHALVERVKRTGNVELTFLRGYEKSHTFTAKPCQIGPPRD